MSRLFDAIANARTPDARALLAGTVGLPAEAQPADLPVLRLWQAIETRLPDRPRKVLQIAPCGEGERDPTVAVRLARLAARAMGSGVVVLDSARARSESEGQVAYGPLPGRSGDARELNPELLREYWRSLGERADLVVLDSPPVLSSPLALALAPTVDGLVLLIQAERTRAKVAEAAHRALAAAGATVLGVVLTGRRFHVPRRIYERV